MLIVLGFFGPFLTAPYVICHDEYAVMRPDADSQLAFFDIYDRVDKFDSHGIMRLIWLDSPSGCHESCISVRCMC